MHSSLTSPSDTGKSYSIRWIIAFGYTLHSEAKERDMNMRDICQCLHGLTFIDGMHQWSMNGQWSVADITVIQP
jgi:hypothetical protein